MDFTSYQVTSDSTASLNTGSYLNPTEYSLFVKGYAGDLWYAFSEKDAMEVGIWDREGNLVGWNTLNQSKSYNTINVATFNTLNYPTTYSYRELKPDFILYKNEKVLVNPSEQVSSSFEIVSGSYFITYNCTREMAGSPINPLVIKDISPSRKELKLVPLAGYDLSYTAFCERKLLAQDVSSLYLRSVKDCQYGKIYNQVSPYYVNEINTIKAVFFISTDGGMLTFFKNLYEDLLLFSSIPVAPVLGSDVITQNLIRIQGIQTYFNNYLLKSSDTIISFDQIDSAFHGFVSASIERKFSAIGPHPTQDYVKAKAFVYDYFTKYFYDPITTLLTSAYNEKYFSFFKNGLNVGNNRLLPILNTAMMDERVEPTDPLTLLVKLKDELPIDLEAQTQCWVSNISLSPQIVSAIIKNPSSRIVHTIGPPNFSIPIPNASLTNTNMAYTADDLREDDQTTRELTVSKNITELSVDYSCFENFVVFSSAELRLKIFKNKVMNLYSLSSSLELLANRNSAFMAASGSVYPYYTQEYDDAQGQITNIVNSFDGYESYLYRSGDYTYSGSGFVSASYIAEMDSSASLYDTENRDSLINNCPEHILSDSNNDDYIVFLSMIGHFFDDLYVYIAGLPSERVLGNDSTGEFTRRVVDYMLETFGWNLDDSLEQSNILNNYLTSDQIAGLNAMSAEERLKTVRNRLLINLPEIYKTKGTEEAVRLIMACYGIPLVLLNIREYGGVTYDDTKASYTLYERIYMRQWDTSSIHDAYYLQCPTGSHTYLFKISIDSPEPYAYYNEQILFGQVRSNDPTSISGSGEWAVGFMRIPKQNTGKLFFRIGYDVSASFKMYSQEFPLFDGNIYSVMLRRNAPDEAFEYAPNADAVPAKYDLYVKRNEFGNQIVNLTSSVICYDIPSNVRFGGGGQINIGGWFADHNGQGFTGAMDKFQMWRDVLPDSNLEDYTNNFSAYSFRGDTTPYQSLMFRMHTDYPFDQTETGIWRNGNPYLAVSSSAKLAALYGEPNANVDYMVSYMPWSGSCNVVYDSGSCEYVSQSTYPYQFKVIDYPSTWGISRYGPNKFRNEKVRFLTQSVEARFDNLARSTYVPPSNTAPDSNQVGFFVDPQDFKNRDIVRYFGNFDFMDAIGDPAYQFSQSYDSMRAFRHEYATNRIEYSGSRTLFNELCTIYKMYFNRSVFDSIKNVIPARTNALLGVVIEPTILERPKYQLKVISSSAEYAYSASVHHYFHDTTSLVRLGVDLVPSYSMDLGTRYLAYPTRDYPINYGGNIIQDLSDKYELGHFAAGVPTRTIEFEGTPLYGYAPLRVYFTNQSFGANSYQWDFGDGTTSTEVSPVHDYALPGIYTVTLNGYYGRYGLRRRRINYVVAIEYVMSCDFLAVPTSGEAPLDVDFTNLSTNATHYSWSFGVSSVSTSSLLNPSYEYENPGLYTVALSAYAFPLGTPNTYAATHISNSYISVSAQPAVPATCDGPHMREVEGGGGIKPYMRQRNYSLGSVTGTVTFEYSIPSEAARYLVVVGGTTLLDTGWLSYDTSINQLNRINAALAAYSGVPPWLTATSVVSAAGGNVTFEKPVTDHVATVQVYNPFSTEVQYTMSCPVPPPHCGGTFSTSGGKVPPPYYVDYPVTLGAGEGVITLNFQAFTVPDRWQLIIDGVVVLDTQFRGLTAEYSRNYRNELDALGFSDIPIISPGTGTVVYNKTQATSVGTLRVWSPLNTTGWNCSIVCS